MPCATTHMYLAERVLTHWRRRTHFAPFPVERPELREAFLHGAMAPDMGFVPGVDRFVSELAHYVRPAELTRSLFQCARTGREEAFAWGWASHVLGDVALHPQVGRAVGERIHGDRHRRMDAAEDLVTHVGMEVGLDLVLMLGGNGGETPPRRPFFGTSDVRFLERALGRTYNLSWRPGSLLSDHRRAVFLTWLWPRALQLLGRSGAPEGAPRGAAGRIVSALTGWARPHTDPVGPARGFLRPLPPPEWLPTRVLAYGDQIRDEMDLLVERGPESLEDRNLETGDWAGSGRGHPASDHAARKLADRSSQGVGSPQPTVGGSPVRRPGPGLPSPGT